MRTLTTIKTSILIVAAATLCGCYYTQAVRGQLDVLGSRVPIDEVLADPDTSDALAARLRLVQDARRYAVDALGLPENASYETYADLDREYVVWNVFAAEEFSLQPKRWCYPVVGCVAYRGYFEKSAAERFAQKLGRQGLDVHVGGVGAYSTLGKFNDPVLSTMMRWSDVQLVGVLFHELAHQQLYIRDDTAFNESFATAVEEIGIERFLGDRGLHDAIDEYAESKEFRRQLLRLIDAARRDLNTYYAETIDPDEKRLLKEHRIERLTSALRRLLTESGRDAGPWLEAPFNNARLVSYALYEGQLPAFRRMYADCDEELSCFYEEARRVAEFDKSARDAYLDSLATR